jgi:hypothetical protein
MESHFPVDQLSDNELELYDMLRCRASHTLSATRRRK